MTEGIGSRLSAFGSRPSPLGNYRWTICALLFVATTINYIDRQVLGILAPTLQRELHWSEADYGDIVSWFSFAYAVGFLVAGRLLDRVGVRRGLAAAVVAWSLAAIGHAFARTAAGFSIARAMLGLGESAIFPGSIKAVAEWFPQKERALATGIFNAGTNTGAILTPLLVPWITLRWGWQWAFIGTGALGFVWLVLWALMYRDTERAEGRGPKRYRGSASSGIGKRGRLWRGSCWRIRSGGSTCTGCRNSSTRRTV